LRLRAVHEWPQADLSGAPPGAPGTKQGTKTIVEPDTIIRGDMAKVKVGKHCIIRRGAVLRPSYKKIKDDMQFLPVSLGNHTYVGERTVVEALKVGSHVYIGSDCVVGKACNPQP
jgi:dynactin-5